MTATSALTTALQRQVLLLEDDLRDRVAADHELEGRWKQEHQQALDKERTAASWVAWRDDRVTQAAVAWVLTSVFIRFCEDNGLVGPVWITGPEQRRQEALDAQLAFFRTHPEDTDREWLQSAIDHLAALPATTGAGGLTFRAAPGHAVRQRGHPTSGLLAGPHRGQGARPRPARPIAVHPFPRRPVPGPVPARQGHLRAAADPGFRGGVHPRPHTGTGAERTSSGRLPDGRPHLRVGTLPARSVRPVAGSAGTSMRPAWSFRRGFRRRWTRSTAWT